LAVDTPASEKASTLRNARTMAFLIDHESADERGGRRRHNSSVGGAERRLDQTRAWRK
jgi:hypothetical protein